MHHVAIRNQTRPLSEPVHARYCASFFCQLRGLTFRRSLPRGEGLLLVQKSDGRIDAAIHMLGVWIDLAVVWINSAYEVVDVRLARPWRPVYLPARPARYILEISPSRIGDFKVGDQVFIEDLLDE